LIWYVVQLIIIFSFIIGIYNIYKKEFKIGIVQIVLSPIVLIGNFIFSMHRNWVNGNETEQEYFVKMISDFDINSILILLGVLVLIILLIISIKNYINKNFNKK